MGSLFAALPNELLCQILSYLPPESIPVVQRLSKRFEDVPQPTLWRSYCISEFGFWSSAHEIERKLASNIADTDWKALFVSHQKTSRSTTKTLNDILGSQDGRIEKSKTLLALGEDAKDALLKNLNAASDVDDVLARRYYSRALLDTIHRSLAISEWINIVHDVHVPLERALGALDMFIAHGNIRDMSDISKTLDDLAATFIRQTPEHQDMSPKRKSEALIDFLRARELLGIRRETDADYRKMQTNFIGVALHDPEHSSKPLISVAIFCAIAERLGIGAYPCALPFHVIAVVEAGRNKTKLSMPNHVGPPAHPIFFDPFRSSSEVPLGDLKLQLGRLGISARDQNDYLVPTSTAEIVHRCARNIITSTQWYLESGTAEPSATEIDSNDAIYSAIWAIPLLSKVNGGLQDPETHDLPNLLPHILSRLEKLHPFDVQNARQMILPLLPNQRASTNIKLDKIVAEHDKVRTVKRRQVTSNGEQIRFKIGQYFRHGRFDYHAVIFGWDIKCMASKSWILQMRVDDLQRGRNQSFYNVLVEDGSTRYVAEDNIILDTSKPSEKMMALAGQYFKRWDTSDAIFISNIKDEYPDD